MKDENEGCVLGAGETVALHRENGWVGERGFSMGGADAKWMRSGCIARAGISYLRSRESRLQGM